MTLILENSSDQAPLEALRERCQRNPNSKLFMPLAEQLRRRGCYSEAIDICMRAKTIHPRYVSCRVLLGRCLIELGMREEARQELEDVLKLDRENVLSLRIMAEILRAQGDLKGAVDYYRALVRICPTDMDAHQRVTELVQLIENSQNRESVAHESSSRHGERTSSSQLLEEGALVGSDTFAVVSSAAGSLRVSLPSSRQVLRREIKRSDFSRFAQWVNTSWQDGRAQQGRTNPVGHD